MAQSKPITKSSYFNPDGLFQLMVMGDLQIKLIKEKAFLFIGITRSGKSSGINWVKGKSLIGKEQYGETFYVSQTQGESTSNKFSSQTKIPSTTNLLIKDVQISLLDMPGAQQNRSYKQTTAIAHCLFEILRTAKQVKFVLVIEETNFVASQINVFSSPFNYFFDLFNIKKMSKEEQNKLYQSAYILITKASSSRQIFNKKFEGISKKLEDKNLRNAQYRQYIRQLLTKIVKQERFDLFQQAVVSQHASKPQKIIDDMINGKSWKFLVLDEVRTHIQNNFIKSYDNMNAQDKKQLMQDIAFRKQTLPDFRYVFEIFLKKFLKNMYENECSYDQQIEFYLKPYISKYNLYLKPLQNGNYPVNKNDVKSAINFDVTVQQNEQNKKISNLQAIQSLNQLYNKTICLQFSEQKAQNIFKLFEKNMVQSIGIFLKLFSSNYKDQLLCMDLAYIMHRHFREVSSLYTLNSQISSSYNQYKGDLNTLCQVLYYDIDKIFIFDTFSKKGQKFYSQLKKNQQLLQKFLKHVKVFKPIGDDQSKYKQIYNKILILKGDLYMLQKNPILALYQYNKGYQQFNDFKFLNKQKYKDQSQFHPSLISIIQPSQQNQEEFYKQEQNRAQQIQPEEQNFIVPSQWNPEQATFEDVKKVDYKIKKYVDLRFKQYQVKMKNVYEIDDWECNIYQHIAKALVEINGDQSLNLACQVYTLIRFYQQAYNVYQKKVNKCNTKQKRYKQLTQYAEYAKNNCQLGKAKQLYQRAYQQASGFIQKKKTNLKIKELLTQVDERNKIYCQKLDEKQLIDQHVKLRQLILNLLQITYSQQIKDFKDDQVQSDKSLSSKS